MIEFGASERDAARRLIHLALAEDLMSAELRSSDLETVALTERDVTSASMIDAAQTGTVQVISRADGILAGGPIGPLVFAQVDPLVTWTTLMSDGDRLESGSAIAEVSGPIRSLLTGERTALNFLTHLSGVASLTRRYVDAVSDTRAIILDTRKTLPGYRVLQKYAVRAGGGQNHRMGLYDAIMIKDNHLAAWTARTERNTLAVAIQTARRAVSDGFPIEIEVDTLDQLDEALVAMPGRVLLDNMNPEQLHEAVRRRDRHAPDVSLEASGGITLETIRPIAESGVEFISIGGLTHSAPTLDLAFDWKAAIA